MTEKAKGGAYSVWTRIIAILLAVTLLAGIVVYQQTNVAVNPEPMENKAVRLAAKGLLEEGGYISASRLERMGEYVANLFRGRNRFEDYDKAAQIAAAQGKNEEAITLTGKAIDLYEGGDEKAAELYFRMGYLHVLQNNFAEARKWLDFGLKLKDYPEAKLIRSQVLLNLGETEEALKGVSEYLQSTPGGDQNLADLINVYEAAGDYDTAVQLYTRLIDDSGKKEYALNRAYCYANLGQTERAVADRNTYAENGGNEVAAADVMLGISMMRNGQYDQAGERFIMALDEKYPDPESLYYYIVLCSYISKNYGQACTYGDQLIRRINEGKDEGVATVDVEKTTGKLQVNLAKTDISSLCLMTGASHIQTGSFDQAVESLSECLKRNEGVVYANYLRGTCLLAAERYEEAEADFNAAIEAGEEVEKSRYGRGVCRMELGNKEGAKEDFDWVILHGTDDELFAEAGVLLNSLLQPEEKTEEESEVQSETKSEENTEEKTEEKSETNSEEKAEEKTEETGEKTGETEETPQGNTEKETEKTDV